MKIFTQSGERKVSVFFMNKRKISAVILALILLLSQSLVLAQPTDTATSQKAESNASTEQNSNSNAQTDEATAVEESKAEFPEPRANAAVLFDLNGGRVLYESNSTEKVYPASVTKIMTAMLVLEKGNLADTVTVSDSALSDITYLHSKINLKSGEQLTVEQLLTALLVSSANDAANVLAEYISGNIQAFVTLMNERAAELGMTGTHFVNPHGFHDDNHYTTAHDMQILTRQALQNDKFCELVKIKTYRLPATNMSDERMLSTTNHLISKYRNTAHYYQYATGVKTGSTDEAGNCLVATAEKGGIKLLSLVFGCENADQKENAYSFVDTTRMFEYVFNNFKSVTIATTSDIISDSKVYEAKDNTRVALTPSKDVSILLPKDFSEENIKTDIKLPETINAPIEKGVSLGSVTYTFDSSFDGEPFHITVDLLSANAVKRDHFLHFLHGIANFFLSPFVIIPLLTIAALLLFGAINRNKRRKARRRNMKSHHRPRTSSTQARSKVRNVHTANRYSSTRGRPSSQRRRTPPKSSYDPWDKYR